MHVCTRPAIYPRFPETQPNPAEPYPHLVVGVLDVRMHLTVLRGGHKPLKGIEEHFPEDGLENHVKHVRGDASVVCHARVDDALDFFSLFGINAPHLRAPTRARMCACAGIQTRGYRDRFRVLWALRTQHETKPQGSFFR